MCYFRQSSNSLARTISRPPPTLKMQAIMCCNTIVKLALDR